MAMDWSSTARGARYRNQGWKDSGDSIVDEEGRDADLPIATVELQGYWFAALHAMAEIDERCGSPNRASERRVLAAGRLHAAVESSWAAGRRSSRRMGGLARWSWCR